MILAFASSSSNNNKHTQCLEKREEKKGKKNIIENNVIRIHMHADIQWIQFFLMTTDALLRVCVCVCVWLLNRRQCCFCSIFDYCIIDWTLYVCLSSHIEMNIQFFFVPSSRSLSLSHFVVCGAFYSFNSQSFSRTAAKKLISMTYISSFEFSFFLFLFIFLNRHVFFWSV